MCNLRCPTVLCAIYSNYTQRPCSHMFPSALSACKFREHIALKLSKSPSTLGLREGRSKTWVLNLVLGPCVFPRHWLLLHFNMRPPISPEISRQRWSFPRQRRHSCWKSGVKLCLYSSSSGSLVSRSVRDGSYRMLPNSLKVHPHSPRLLPSLVS